MTSRTFTSTLNVEGNAKDRLREITQGSRALANVSSQTSISLQKLGSDLNLATKAQSTGVGITSIARATGELNLKVEKLSPALRELADRGLAIAEQATQKYNAAIRAGGPDSAAFRGEMRKNAVEVREFANRLDRLSRQGGITGASLGALAANFRQLPRTNELAQGFQGIASTLGSMSTQMIKFKQRSNEAMSLANVGTNNLTGSQLGAVQSAERLSQELTRVSQSGSMSATTLTRLANRADAISRQAAPALSSQLRGMSAEMRRLSIDAQMTEQQFKKTGSQFQFMEDVSKGTQKRFRQVSAASQGLMLSMGALSGNLQSLAFSLIFLQFSGAIKLSLAFAGLSAAAMVATKGVKKFLENRKELKILSDTIGIVTKNTLAFSLVNQRATAITEKLGLAEDDAKDFAKGLTAIMIELRARGIEPTSDMLELFTAVMAFQMKARGKDAKEAMDMAASSVIDFASDLDKSAVSIGDYELPFDTIIKDGIEALQLFPTEFKLTLDDVRELAELKGIDFEGPIERAVYKGNRAFDELPAHMQSEIIRLLKITDEEFAKLNSQLPQTIEVWEEAFTDRAPRSSTAAADSIIGIRDELEFLKQSLEDDKLDFKRPMDLAIHNMELARLKAQEVTDQIHAMERSLQFTALEKGATSPSSGTVVDPEYSYSQSKNVQRKTETVAQDITTYDDPGAWDVRDIQGTKASDTKIEVTVNGNFQGSPQANGQAIAGSIKALWGMNSTGYQPRI